VGIARTGAADPVLADPKLPRPLVGATAAGEQPGVDLAGMGLLFRLEQSDLRD
jgi:hypothetical protein